MKTARQKRCSSCKNIINLENVCLKFKVFRDANCDIEDKIYGEGGYVPLENKYMCEECTDLYLYLDDLGVCINLWCDDMRELVKEYEHEHR